MLDHNLNHMTSLGLATYMKQTMLDIVDVDSFIG